MSIDLDTETIYEIFRACRLCGAGGGYKMPIIPSVVGFDCPDIELRQKIRECVQIEVNQDDKMPPLICEVCIDKVNDFYEFVEMCQETNKNTRLRLGLPPQAVSQGISESGDCILGVTEQITYTPSTPDESMTPQPKLIRVKKAEKVVDKKKENDKRVKGLKKELENLIKNETPVTPARRLSRSQSIFQSLRSSSPAPLRSRTLRQSIAGPRPSKQRDTSVSSNESKRSSRTRSPGDDRELSRLRNQDQQQTYISPKDNSILRKRRQSMFIDSKEDVKTEPDFEPRPKRLRDKSDMDKQDTHKKVSFTAKRSPSPQIKPTPKSTKPAPKSMNKLASKLLPPSAVADEPPLPTCDICLSTFRFPQGLSGHMKKHTVNFTAPDLACNSCGEWFENTQQVTDHHQKEHRQKNKTYKCRGCHRRYAKYQSYVEHTETTKCVPYKEVPDVDCSLCHRAFPTRLLFDAHKKSCQPVVTCTRCNRTYQSTKSFKKHEVGCRGKHTDSSVIKIDPKVRKSLLTAQIRLIRCDHLLKKNSKKTYDVSRVPSDFDLDKKSVYPYRAHVKRKKALLDIDKMVIINRDIQQEFYREEDYVHWDSDLSSDSDEDYVEQTTKSTKVPSLTKLSLKTIYSKRCLGKVPRKLRKVKDKVVINDTNNDVASPIVDNDSEVNGECVNNDGDKVNAQGDDSVVQDSNDTQNGIVNNDVSLNGNTDVLDNEASKVLSVEPSSDLSRDLLLNHDLTQDSENISSVNDIENDTEVGNSKDNDNDIVNDTDVGNSNNDIVNDTEITNSNDMDIANSKDSAIANETDSGNSKDIDVAENNNINRSNHVSENNDKDKETNEGDSGKEAIVNDITNVNEELNEMVDDVIKEIHEIGSDVNDLSVSLNGDSLTNNDFLDGGNLLADFNAEIDEKELEDEDISGKDKDKIMFEDVMLLPKGDNGLEDISEGDFNEIV